MSNIHLRLTFLLLFLPGLFVQANSVDSLKNVLQQKLSAEQKCKTLIELGIEYRNRDADTSLLYLNDAVKLARKNKWEVHEANANNQLAATHIRLNNTDIAFEQLRKIYKSIHKLEKKYEGDEQKKLRKLLIENLNFTGNALRKSGKFEEAINYYEDAANNASEYNELELLTGIYNDLAQTKYMQGLYPASLNYCLKGIELNKKIKNKQGLASSTGNAGILFKEMGDYKKAIEYFEKALKLNEELGNKKSIAVNLGNIGVGYGHLGNPKKSIEYYNKAIQIHEELNDEDGLVYNYNNIAIEYTKFKKYDLSLVYFNKSFEILERNPDDYTLTFTNTSIASTYLQMGNLEKAEEHLLMAKATAEKMNTMDQMSDVYRSLSDLYQKKKEPEKALSFYKSYIRFRDTIINEENLRTTISSEENFKYREKTKQDSLINAQQQEIKNAELEAKNSELHFQQIILIISVVGLILLIVFAVIIFNRFKVSQQQNKIIQEQKIQVENQKKDLEVQKNLVDVKQKEIIDSINYAQRIQAAILTTEEEIRKVLPDSFLYYRPKDIVAGDFYFFEVTPTHVFIAAADCTGHGVPGALMSVVCSNSLTRCVYEFGLTDPGDILNKTRDLVLETLRKSGTDIKDGMDISLLSMNYIANTSPGNSPRSPFSFSALQWSGANNSLWYLEKGNMKEVPADKQSIGQNYQPHPFTTHTLQIEKGTQLFLFTDGFADQFGGPEGKKYKYSRLQKFFTQQLHPFTEGKTILDKEFNNWRGDMEQIDDVCIIGIRV